MRACVVPCRRTKGTTCVPVLCLGGGRREQHACLCCALQEDEGNNMRACVVRWSCVKVEVAVQGSPSLISLMVSVDVKQH